MRSSPFSTWQTGTETCWHLDGVWQREVKWLGLIPPVPRCFGRVNTLVLREHRWALQMCKKTFVAVILWQLMPSGCSIPDLSHQHLARSI